MKNSIHFLAVSFCAAGLGAIASQNATAEPGCANSAHTQRLACDFDLRDDFYTRSAQCHDSANPDPVCFDDAGAEFDDGLEECDEVLGARLDLCESLGDATHDPEFGPDFAENFVDPLQIGGAIAPNPWFALVPGNLWVYEGDDETIEVEVTSETKLIDGVTCIVVVDTATEDDVVVEVTDDWYAQALDGNVWYCGEISENFEEFDGDDAESPELVDIDGSWKSGRDGAEAGILLPAEPLVGDVFEVLAIDATETSAGGFCEGTCLMTLDFTPLEPDAAENKFYLAGTGLIVEVDLESGDRVELTSFTGVGQ